MKVKKIKKKSKYEVTLKLNHDELEALKTPVIDHGIDIETLDSYQAYFLTNNEVEAYKLSETLHKLLKEFRKNEY